ncbi:carboxypeptidase regulatory-like domain-containing protein [Rufibacter ruber]|uniref:carboxypeptidase regulatory-like domain-containing protein n=1 Tax=Rufibacter ruber TaxID=1783499 RepID=UPI000835C98C|nr:carboxypeptidase regulatory-like domain-containing protein [Rufibacter ruber]
MKKRALFLLGLLCLCLCLPGSGAAQVTPQAPATVAAPGTISGTLVDSLSGKPIEYATVALVAKGTSAAVGGTLTNTQGQFSFHKIALGQYTLVFSFLGT